MGHYWNEWTESLYADTAWGIETKLEKSRLQIYNHVTYFQKQNIYFNIKSWRHTSIFCLTSIHVLCFILFEIVNMLSPHGLFSSYWNKVSSFSLSLSVSAVDLLNKMQLEDETLTNSIQNIINNLSQLNKQCSPTCFQFNISFWHVQCLVWVFNDGWNGVKWNGVKQS